MSEKSLNFTEEYGQLTIIGYGDKKTSDKKILYTCKCSCGKITYATRYQLLSGKKTRCEECARKSNESVSDEEFIGNTYNNLKILKKSEERNSQGKVQYVCMCTLCGKDNVLARKSDVVRGRKKACPECSKKLAIENKRSVVDAEMIGKMFDYLKVIERVPSDRSHHNSKWLCLCTKCGNTVVKYKDELERTNRTYPLSCPNCIPVRTTDEERLVRSAIIDLYRSIHRSCYDSSYKAFHLYGAKGVKLCNEWFINKEKFVNWCLDNGFDTDMTINLIDKTKDYSPDNCEIITKEDKKYERLDSRRTSDGYSVMRLCKDNGFDYDEVCRVVPSWKDMTKEQLYYRVINDPLLFQKN